jgi:hypothetical protein
MRIGGMKNGRRHKLSRWIFNRWAALAASLVVAGVATLAWHTPEVVDHRLNQDDVRKEIAEHIAARLMLKVGMQALQWSGLHVSSDGMLMLGEPPRSLTELRAHRLEADGSLAEILEGKWRIDSMSADHVEMAFGEAAKEKLSDPLNPAPSLEQPSERPPLLKTEFGRLTVPHTDVFWGKTKDGLGWLKGVATETTREDDHYKIVGKGGEFQQHGWPKAELSGCTIAYGEGFLEIKDSSLTLGESGRVNVTGKFNFGQQSEMKLAFAFHGCPATPFLHGGLRTKFAGTFSGETHITELLEENSDARIEGSVEFAAASLRNIAGLSRVADFTGHDEFRHPKLSVLRGRYVASGNSVEVNDLVAEIKGTAMLEGHLTVKGDRLRGRFELGVAPGIVEKFPGAREEVFTREKGGLVWTTVAVSGTLKEPETDLKERLVKAAEAYFGKKILAGILKPGNETIEILRQLW